MVVAVCSLIGTLVGSLAGIMTANKLTNYRIEQLEDKVKKHNNLIERMAIVEQSAKSAHHRIDEIIEKEMDS
nr:MAG TPA: hemolysin [Caudoviricetes sp.]